MVDIMTKMIVVYQPSPGMKRIVENMGINRFIKMVPLSEMQGKRARQLREIPDDVPAIYVWGSGYYHGESYFFDANNTDIKVNFDAHTDAETRSGRIGHLYLSHMYQSAKKHNCVSICYCNHHFHLVTSNGFKIVDGSPIPDPKRIEFSVDLDIVNNFPAEEIWWGDSEIDLPGLIEKMHEAREKIQGRMIRFDVGGMRLHSEELTESQWRCAIECYNAVLEAGYKFIIER